MRFCVSTHWNAFRHASGEALAEEILALGLRDVELGYDLTADLAPGIRRLVEQGALSVAGAHNYCPVPPGAGRGHPELYSPSSLDERERASAVLHTTRTAEFCAEMGARHVVMHGGYARTRATTQHLIAMAAEGRGNSPAFDKARLKLQMQREKQADRFLAQLRRSIEELLPAFERLGMTLAIENLPSWEAVPSETEMARLLEDFSSARLAYWHDTGHGQIRQNLGFSAHYHWFDRLCPRLAGMHVHDVVPPASDHLMPPAGEVDFGRFAAAARSGVPLVLEPAPGTPPQQIRDALRFLQTLWSAPRPAAEVSAQ